MRDVGIVDAELCLSDEDISIPKIYEQIAIVCLETVLDSNDFKLLSVLCHFCILHFVKQRHDFFSTVPLNLTSQQIIDVEDELFPFLFVISKFGFF